MTKTRNEKNYRATTAKNGSFSPHIPLSVATMTRFVAGVKNINKTDLVSNILHMELEKMVAEMDVSEIASFIKNSKDDARVKEYAHTVLIDKLTCKQEELKL